MLDHDDNDPIDDDDDDDNDNNVVDLHHQRCDDGENGKESSREWRAVWPAQRIALPSESVEESLLLGRQVQRSKTSKEIRSCKQRGPAFCQPHYQIYQYKGIIWNYSVTDDGNSSQGKAD